jgi:ssDNA-binding Zn-finger/Zn-ribbon topoisomerase 1
MIWVGIGIAGLLFAVIILLFTKRKASKLSYRFQKVSRIMNPSEKNFYECLVEDLGDQYDVFCKVEMNQVLKPKRSVSGAKTSSVLTQFGGFFDFVICNRSDMSIYGVIELENFNKATRASFEKEREVFINRICEKANIKLFIFDVQQSYHNVDLKKLITGEASEAKKFKEQNSQVTIENDSYAYYTQNSVCPKCQGGLSVKVAVKGPYIGDKFLMCKKFPVCDYRKNLKKVSVDKLKEMQEKQEAVKARIAEVQAKGFKNWA